VREIKVKDCRTPQEVEETHKRFDRVSNETLQVDAIRSYREAVTGNRRFGQQYPANRQREPRQGNFIRKEINCWTCGETGHINRQCPKRNTRRYFECGSEKHMKKDCDKVRCFRHKQYECFAGRDYPRQALMRPTRTLDRQGGYDRSNYHMKRLLQRRIIEIIEDENVYTRKGDDD